MKRHPTEIKSKIRKNTELIVFLDVITIKAEKIAITEKNKKRKCGQAFIYIYLSNLIFFAKTDSHLSPLSNNFFLL